MWWQVFIGLVVGSLTGGGCFYWGYIVGYNQARKEDSYEKYVGAMTDDDG